METQGGSAHRSLSVTFQMFLKQKAENASLVWVWRVGDYGMTLGEHLNSLKDVARDTCLISRGSLLRGDIVERKLKCFDFIKGQDVERKERF